MAVSVAVCTITCPGHDNVKKPQQHGTSRDEEKQKVKTLTEPTLRRAPSARSQGPSAARAEAAIPVVISPETADDGTWQIGRRCRSRKRKLARNGGAQTGQQVCKRKSDPAGPMNSADGWAMSCPGRDVSRSSSPATATASSPRNPAR